MREKVKGQWPLLCFVMLPVFIVWPLVLMMVTRVGLLVYDKRAFTQKKEDLLDDRKQYERKVMQVKQNTAVTKMT